MSGDQADQPERAKPNEARPAQVGATEGGGNSCESCDRRTALSTGSTLLMAGGLLGGYGTFFTMAGQYFFPSQSNQAWMFVGAAVGIEPGGSVAFESPIGVRVMITRREEEPNVEASITANSFLALSSVCPHLGCVVHWEAHNDRFFCPCHNGVFNPDGKAIGGPPAAAGQNLPQYPLKVVDGGLYIEMPFRGV